MNVLSEPIISREALTDEVECYALKFLLQYRFRRRQVDKDRLIITVDERRTIDRNAKHIELVSKAPQLFCCLIHCNELTTKRASLHCSLILGMPVDWSIVQHDNESRPKP